MLTARKLLDSNSGVYSGCAWFSDLLWVGCCAPNGNLLLRWVDVRGSGVDGMLPTVMSFGGPRTGDETIALAAYGDRLWVAFGRLNENWSLTSMSKTKTFAAAVPLPIDGGILGPAGLAAYPGGVALMWTETFGAQAHILSSSDGLTFADTLLPFAAGRRPALMFDPDQGRLLAGFVHANQRDKTIVAGVTPGAWTIGAPSIEVPCAAPALNGLALARGRYHASDRLHLITSQVPEAGLDSLVAFTMGADLIACGGPEQGYGRPRSIAAASEGGQAWVAVTLNSNELFVAPHLSAFDLPPELRGRLDETCDPDQCPPDPRIACRPTDVLELAWQAPRIANAYRGDLILTKADGEGTIGAILANLSPSQTIDHMGIVLEDYSLIRHCTMAHNRLKEGKRFMRGMLAGLAAPSDGFAPDGVRLGWPGTITQSVEDAFYEGLNTWNAAAGRPFNPHGDIVALSPPPPGSPPDLPPVPGASEDVKARWTKRLEFADPQYPEDTYRITNFPKAPQYHRQSGQLREGVVLKPPPAYEAAEPEIRALLGQIADMTTMIFGHYRFYTYSNAEAAFDPAYGGPAGHWSAGSRPLVCSTFIWAAIELLRRKGVHILLEGEATESADEHLPPSGRDGLYAYDETERFNAAKALHEEVVESVQRAVYAKLHEGAAELSGILTVLKVGLTHLLALLTGPVGVAATFLGLTPAKIGELVILFTDMPEQVATQMCNSFAFDAAEETEERLWEEPGAGISVSPEDIVKFWDVPEGPPGQRGTVGLFGHSQVLLLVPRRRERKRVFRLGRADALSTVRGAVRYRSAAVLGARVFAGCETTTTRIMEHDDAPIYRFDLLPNGDMLIRAEAYWPDTNFMLTGERIVRLQPGDQPDAVDIELRDPPEWRRRVRVFGQAHVVRKVLIGKDDTGSNSITMQGELAFFPEEWGVEDGFPEGQWVAAGKSDYAQRFCIWYKVTARLNPDLSVSVIVFSSLCENFFGSGEPGADQILTSDSANRIVPPGGSEDFVFSHNSGNFPPDRARLELTVTNSTCPA